MVAIVTEAGKLFVKNEQIRKILSTTNKKQTSAKNVCEVYKDGNFDWKVKNVFCPIV